MGFLVEMGFSVESSSGKNSSSVVLGYVIGAVFVICGVLLCLAVRLHYGGGLWSFLGVAFVAAAILRAAFMLDVFLRGSHFLSSPFMFYSTVAAFWGIGCYCLVWGHMRHHRKKKYSHHGAA